MTTPDNTISNTVTCSNVVPGAYSVTECDPAAGLRPHRPDAATTPTRSGTGYRTASIILEAGETVTCTFTNTQRGTIVIVKDTVPNGPTDFSFTDDIPGCSRPAG